ncbi:MAG: carbon-nitrogen hydrolase family protein [Chloroflexi bacterium]|nr:carbon-nitrogen hydrolase family protein [Chloroflexota bacterium]
MKVLTYQPRIEQIQSASDRRGHVRRMLQVLAAKCRQVPDIDLVVLPELATVEYSVESFEKLSELAEPVEGETFTAVSAFARKTGCTITYGFPLVKNNQYFISQIVVGASGERITDYSKLHLAQFGASMERDYFSRGNKLAIFELKGFRFGIIICYDFRFSELIKRLVTEYQIDVMLHPVAFTKDGTFASWHHFVISRALEHQIYFLSLNRAGEAWGNSILCPPWIDEERHPVMFGEQEELCVFTIDKQVIQSVREQYPFRMDKLADYSILEAE